MPMSFPPSAGRSATAISRAELQAAGNGQAFLHNGAFVTHIPRAIGPQWITDPSGMLGAPRFVTAPPNLVGPRWAPDADLQLLNGNSIGDQPITMQPYRRYIIERVDVINSTAAASGVTFGLFTNAGGTGIPVLAAGSTLDGLTDDLRSRKTFGGLDLDVEAPQLYLNVTTANATPISFVMMIFGRVLVGSEE